MLPGPSQSSQGKVLPPTALPHLWSIGMEPPLVLPSHLLHSRIVNILITLCSGRTGKAHPHRRKIFNGRVNAGLLYARFSSKALIAITFRTKGMRSHAHPAGLITTAWSP